ncbi:hypothetical protein ACOMHN_038568 [Nucella lapillus]
MATGGGEGNLRTCAVCLVECQDRTKVLPCNHRFCGTCLQGVADRHNGRSFPCPTCGLMTSLPSGGKGGAGGGGGGGGDDPQSQNPLPTPTPHPFSARVPCQRHPEEKLKYYCRICKIAICIDCKMTRHEFHVTDDLAPAACEKKEELETCHRQRLQRGVSSVREDVVSLKEEKQFLGKKRAAVEKSVRDRHAIVMAAADRERDKVLSRLKSEYTDMDKNVDGALQQRQRDEKELQALLQQVDDAIDSGTASDVIKVANVMTSGCGSQLQVDILTSRGERTLQRPVHQFEVGTDVIKQTISGCMGSVRKMEMKERRPEVKVTERFQCAQDPDVEVFSLCHDDTDPPRVLVSFERLGIGKGTPRKAFTETGKCKDEGSTNKVGKVSYKRYAKGRCMYPPSRSGCFRTFGKSPTATHFRLDNGLSGQADINKVTVTVTDPFKDKAEKEFTIQVGPHRAFDVDDTEKYFVVVEEEGKESSHWRSVHLFLRSQEKAVSTYTPPTEQYQPSDVCFYTLGEQKVLLITDERNDAIHVVTIQGNTMQFERFLCEGCPSLIQPLAIAVDLQRRLWVACRGGSVLTIEQID